MDSPGSDEPTRRGVGRVEFAAIFARALAIVLIFSRIAFADPIGPYHLFGEQLPLAAIVFTCLLSSLLTGSYISKAFAEGKTALLPLLEYMLIAKAPKEPAL